MNIRKNPYEKNIIAQCDLCGQPIKTDRYKNAKCEFCGWCNCAEAVGNPNKVFLPNFVSLNKGKKLYQEGKQLKPNFEEFLEFFNLYGEAQFSFNNCLYGIARSKNAIDFFDCKSGKVLQSYNSIAEFAENANINGTFLKNIWDKVSNIDYLQ